MTSSAVEAAAPAAAAVPGVQPMDDTGARWQRRAVLVLTIGPLVGVVLAIVATWGWGIGVADAAIALAFYLVTGFGVTVGYHRLFTHRSFDAARPLKIALAVAGSMAVQGSLIEWVATHRRHHAFSDRDGDPHSPHLDDGPGVAGVVRGLWHAHVGWLAAPERTVAERWAPDLLRDRDLVLVDRLFPLLTGLSFALPAVAGWLVTGTAAGAVTAFLWGSLVRVFLLHHVTWSINSICHFYGRRPFSSDDFSTNNWVLSLLSFGESWHNNHHAFPSSAVHGIGRGQVDVSAALIRAFERLRLARNVKLVTPKQLARKAVSEFRPRARILDRPPS
ncbi:MAG TPA: acyl-CoA desaturase [Actinomycetota bacterium]|nr:acyl-CoA desaturase [Actinomycetota bacterium]